MAVFYAMAGAANTGDFFQRMGLALPFVAWVALSSALCIELIRRSFSRLAYRGQLVLIFLLVPVMTLMLSLVIAQIGVPAMAASPYWFVARSVLLALLLSAAVGAGLIVYSAWRRQVQEEASYRLQALQARIRPHFLFNSLNVLSELIHEQPQRAETGLLDLADLLRTGLQDAATHSLAEEIALVEGYLRLEKLRLGERLDCVWDLDDALPGELQLPPLLLQPLVENAVVHGIARRHAGGAITIVGQRIRFGRLRFTVSNPLADAGSRPAAGHRSALENIRQRLALAYEERYGLKTWTEDGQFKAELTLPVNG